MPNNSLLYQQLVDAIKTQTPCMLASVIYTANSTSATVGNKAIINAEGDISGWIGGGCCQAIAKKIAPQLLKENKHSVIRICPEKEFVNYIPCYPSHCPSEGTVDIFLEPIATQQAVHLYGDTPTAHSIVHYSKELNIHLGWRQFPDEYLENTESGSANIAIIATQGKKDLVALKQALKNKAEYILLVASGKKATALKEKLQQSGISTKDLKKIIAPAGIDIGATNGAEIALSIMAKVVSLKQAHVSQQPVETEASTDTLSHELSSTTPASSSCCEKT